MAGSEEESATLPRDKRLRVPEWIGGWAKDTGLVLTSQASVTVMTTTVSVLLARSLRTAQFGTFAGYLGLSQALSLAVDVGLATWLLRELSGVWAGDDAKAARLTTVKLMRGVLRFNLQSGAVLTFVIVSVSIAAGVEPDLVVLTAGLLAYVVLIAMATALEAGLRAQRLLKRVVTANVAEKGVLVCGVAVVFIFDLGLVGVAIVYPVAGLTRVAIDYVFTFGRGRRLIDSSRASSLSLVRRAAPFALNAAAFSFVPRLDVPLIALFSATSAAYYALGWQVFTTLVLIPVIGGSTMYPFIARHSKTISLQRVSLCFGFAGVVVATLGIVTTPLLLPTAFGHRYAHAVVVTQIILGSLPLAFYMNGLMVVAYSQRHERELLVWTLACAVLGSAAVVGGQLTLGARGAALGLFVRYVLFTAALLRITRRRSRRLGAPGCVGSVPGSAGAHTPADMTVGVRRES